MKSYISDIFLLIINLYVLDSGKLEFLSQTTVVPLSYIMGFEFDCLFRWIKELPPNL